MANLLKKVYLIVYIVLLNWTILVHCNNCTGNLTFKDGNTTIDGSDLCLMEIFSSGCKGFVKSFNRADLPDVFEIDSYAVEKPSDINLVGLVQDWTDNVGELYKSPGLRIEWKTPVAENSRKSVEGYLVVWDSGNNPLCRLFQFNKSSPLLLKQITFSYDVKYLNSDGANYTVTVYSIPPPPSADKDNENRFVRMRMSSFVKYKYATDSALWSPSVSTKTFPNGTIEVKFTLSPAEFNFTQFDILLLKSSQGINDYYRNISYIGKLYSELEREGLVKFDYLTSETYSVVVRVVDPFVTINGQCLCWKKIPNSASCIDDKCCEASCGSMATSWFFLNVIEPPSVTTTPATTTVSTTAMHDTTNTTVISDVSSSAVVDPGVTPLKLTTDGLTTGQIVGISFGVVAACILLLVILIICSRRGCNASALIKKCCTWENKKPIPHHPTVIVPPSIIPHKYSAYQPDLTLKKLYIMSADDHIKHIEMVESLKKYLELHCSCLVIYPPTEKDINKLGSPYSWFISHISSVDYIICVNSTGAEKLAEAHLSQKVYRDRELRPEGDLFTECLKHIYKDNWARDKVIKIFFDPTKSEAKYIISSFTFGIPKNLPEFIKKIHGVYTKDIGMFSGKLPMLRENIPELPGGAELLSSIELSRQYELNNPDWLKNSFGLPTSTNTTIPKFETMPSVTSNDSGITDMGPRSVSFTDLGDSVKESEYENVDEPISIYTVPYSVGTTSYCNSIIPPEDINSESVPSANLALTRINEDNPSSVDGNSVFTNQSYLPEILFHPPDTMSGVTDVNRELNNINKSTDIFNHWTNASGGCKNDSGQ